MSLPTRSARITKLPVPLTVPPVTRSPGVFSTGIGSPVTIDSSTALRALEHDAVDRHLLAGPHAQPIADAGRASSGTSASAAVGGEPRARSSGRRPSSARIAALVRLRARSSSTWPSSTSVVITAAASK